MPNYLVAYRKLYKHLDTYSGSQFLGIMRENDPSMPDYQQFIESRRKDGKSTIRKDYFKDLLMSYPDDEGKSQIFEVFLKQYEIANPEGASEVRTLLER